MRVVLVRVSLHSNRNPKTSLFNGGWCFKCPLSQATTILRILLALSCKRIIPDGFVDCLCGEGHKTVPWVSSHSYSLPPIVYNAVLIACGLGESLEYIGQGRVGNGGYAAMGKPSSLLGKGFLMWPFVGGVPHFCRQPLNCAL